MERKDLIGSLIDFESGEISSKDMLELFSELIKTGRAWTPQGHYGRTAQRLIDHGYISRKGEILKGFEEGEDMVGINIQEWTNQELIDRYCSMYWTNHIYGQVDCGELHKLTYLEWLISTKENSAEIWNIINERIKKMENFHGILQE